MNTQQRMDGHCEAVTESGCKIWIGHVDKGGYGKIWFNGKCTRTHRVAFEVANGEIPQGLHVLHKCDVRCCVNPDHLFLGTNEDNIKDKVKKGRTTAGMMLGELHPGVKYTETQVLKVKSMLKLGETHSNIECTTKVKKATISKIARGLQWRHLNVQ